MRSVARPTGLSRGERELTRWDPSHSQASDLDVNLEVLAKLQAEARKRST